MFGIDCVSLVDNICIWYRLCLYWKIMYVWYWLRYVFFLVWIMGKKKYIIGFCVVVVILMIVVLIFIFYYKLVLDESKYIVDVVLE